MKKIKFFIRKNLNKFDFFLLMANKYS